MEGGVEMPHHQEEENCLARPSVRQAASRTRNLLLAVICCLLCTCLLGVATAYVLFKNCKTETEDAGAIRNQNQNLPLLMAQKADANCKDDKPCAHLTVSPGNWKTTPNETVIQWEHNISLTFVNGMEYLKPGLKISQAGYYFVYAQVTFSRGPPKNKHDPLTIMIQKITNGYRFPEELFSSSESVHSSSSIPVYLGAVAKLDKNDRLIVNANDIKRIDTTKVRRTFFGAFLI